MAPFNIHRKNLLGSDVQSSEVMDSQCGTTAYEALCEVLREILTQFKGLTLVRDI